RRVSSISGRGCRVGVGGAVSPEDGAGAAAGLTVASGGASFLAWRGQRSTPATAATPTPTRTRFFMVTPLTHTTPHGPPGRDRGGGAGGALRRRPRRPRLRRRRRGRRVRGEHPALRGGARRDGLARVAPGAAAGAPGAAGDRARAGDVVGARARDGSRHR